MIQLELFGEQAEMARAARALDGFRGVDRVREMTATRAGHAVVSARVRRGAVDDLLSELRDLGVGDAWSGRTSSARLG